MEGTANVNWEGTGTGMRKGFQAKGREWVGEEGMGSLSCLEKGRRTPCPPSQKGERGEVFPAARTKCDKPQSHESPRSVSTTTSSVRAWSQEGGSAGRQARAGRAGDPSLRPLLAGVLPPLRRQTKRGCWPARC